MRYIKLPKTLTVAELFIDCSIFSNHYEDLEQTALLDGMTVAEYSNSYGHFEYILDPRIFRSIIIKTLAGQE